MNTCAAAIDADEFLLMPSAQPIAGKPDGRVLLKPFSLMRVAGIKRKECDKSDKDALNAQLLKRFKLLKESGIDQCMWREYEESGLTAEEFKAFCIWKREDYVRDTLEMTEK